MNISQIIVFLMIAFTVGIGSARADNRIFTQHPIKTIIITRQKPEHIVTVFSPVQAQQDLKIISNNFASAGYDVPKVLPFNLQSFQTDIEAPGTALAVSSSDTATLLLDPFFDDPKVKFYAFDETTIIEPISVVLNGESVVGEGRAEQANGPSRPLLLANGPLRDNYETILHPAGLPLDQLNDFFKRAGISVEVFRVYTSEDSLLLQTPSNAIFSDISSFNNPVMLAVTSLFSDPSAYLMTAKVTLMDVTPPLRSIQNGVNDDENASPTVNPTVMASASILHERTIDRSTMQQIPTASEKPKPVPFRREEKSFNFEELAANTCHKITPANHKDRVAFVLGNGSYAPDIGWLENPSNDAAMIAAQLYAANMRVYYLIEASNRVIESCQKELEMENANSDVAMLYYSGHGIQEDDANYLVGIDARNDATLGSHLISLDSLTTRLRSISRSTLIFLDACRDNPFKQTKRGLAALTGQAGSIEIEADKNDFAVVYSAAPDQVSSDGSDETSPFTGAMLAALSQKGVPIQEMIVQVSASVQRATGYMQQPFYRSNLTRLIYLNSESSLQDVQRTAEQQTAKAENLLRQGQRLPALKEILRGMPLNATDAEYQSLFESAFLVLKRAFFSDIRSVWDQDLNQLLAIAPKDQPNVLLFGADGLVRFVSERGAPEKIVDKMEDPGQVYTPEPTVSLDGGKVAYVPRRGVVVVLDITTGEDLFRRSGMDYSSDDTNFGISQLQFSPDGRRLMVVTQTTIVILDIASGKIVNKIDPLRLSDGKLYRPRAQFLTDTHLCFALYPSEYDAPSRAVIGRINLSNEKIEHLYSDDRVGSSGSFKCSEDARYVTYTILAPEKGHAIADYEVLDFDTGQVLIGSEISEMAPSFTESTFDLRNSRVLLTGSFGIIIFDLDAKEFVQSEQVSNSLLGYMDGTTLFFMPTGFELYGISNGPNDLLFEYLSPPTRIIELALSEFDHDAIAKINSERPTLPE